MSADAALIARLRADFPFFAEKCLKIASKDGTLAPFALNKAQLYIHHRLEKQLAERGRVRALVLKGRQQGVSTYTAGRFYHKVTSRKGVSAYILSHQQDTTGTLFEITHRYHRNMPDPLRPATNAASAKELAFTDLGSNYVVGTAGSRETGRGGTTHYFHGSEVAFWPSADSHLAGVMQRVPSGTYGTGTEIILESTANGVGNMFHKMWQDAESGASDYQAIFVPWFWQDEYQEDVPSGWVIPEEFIDYKKMFNLNDKQVRWMELKRRELVDEWKFKQEYPATAAEAFQVSGDEGFIKVQAVQEAALPKPELEAYGPRIGGLDPARGGDRTSWAIRQGRKVWKVESRFTDDLMAVVGYTVKMIEEERLDKLFVDVGGLGAGVYDRLKELGYGHIVEPVTASGSVIDTTRYHNKRAEMWDMMRSWILAQPCEIPAHQSLIADLTAPKWKPHSSGRLLLESKEEMKARGLRSPDEGDALALTFAFPVASKEISGMMSAKAHHAETEWEVI